MLTLWRPYQDLAKLGQDFDDVFSAFGQRGASPSYRPAVDVQEVEGAFVLHADLPGLDEKEIDIRIDGNELVLSGQREATESREDGAAQIRERRFGKFERRFRLGQHIDTQGVKAEYRNGVLSVTLPMSEDAKPRQIPVTVH